ncbi:MAG TPA: primosomal protein N' [Phycisphaerae bacterium]|nr:primosomal protein N' [Phycisphaerae bacterium]
MPKPDSKASPSVLKTPFVSVALPIGLDRLFTYALPERLRGQVRPGQRIRVPFGKGNRPAVGWIVGGVEATDLKSLKAVSDVVDAEPLLTDDLLDLAFWMSRYYVTPIGQVFEAILPAAVKQNAGYKTVQLVVRTEKAESEADRILSKQRRVLDRLAEAQGTPLAPRELARQAGCTPAVIKRLEAKGFVRIETREVTDFARDLFIELEEPKAIHLTAEQALALQRIKNLAVGPGTPGFGVVLLNGVTGSGKTEVYLRAIAEVVAAGQQAIVLVPEIALTPQTIRRFRERFTQVAVLHSNLSDAERHRQWRDIAEGRADVVIGARSAVFAPVRDLGLIVIDEEHENSFKQDTAPRYHGRDVAIMRASLVGAAVVLGSATPSLESYYNAKTVEHYQESRLTQRVGGGTLPPVQIVDLRQEAAERKGAHVLSRALEAAIAEAWRKQEQTILFLNRRGFSTHLFCVRCGHVEKCPDCDVGMTYHAKPGVLRCHYCGRKAEPPARCPACSAETVHYWGTGTQRVVEEVLQKFPDIRVGRMDTDAITKRGGHESILSAFRDGEVDILVGTQMVAKGLDFPNVTVVGVINADVALSLPDFRANERTFQLVMQVAGRAGRGPKGGRVFVQTFQPEHLAIQLAAQHDYESFAKDELESRRSRGYPPFGRLARIVVRSQSRQKAAEAIQRLAERLSEPARAAGIRILGPQPCPAAKLSRFWRYHVLLKAPTAKALLHLWDRVRGDLVPPGGIQMAVDVDPQSTL